MHKTPSMFFADREEAGEKLASVLHAFLPETTDVVIYALPRGGVIPAAKIARALHAPLDTILTRKIGHPFSPEYAIGALSENGVLLLSTETNLIEKEQMRTLIAREQKEIDRRRKAYRNNRPIQSPQGKTAIIVDDGLATGFTMRAAAKDLKRQHPKHLIVAVPVAPIDVIQEIKKDVDDMIVIHAENEYFGAIGRYYTSFPQLTDEEVIAILRSNKQNLNRQTSSDLTSIDNDG